MALTTNTKIAIPNKDRAGRVIGEGIKTVKDLKPNDPIVSYSSKDSYFTNLSGCGASRVESITSYSYQGKLYRINCANKMSYSTYDQGWLVRFNKLAEEKYAVYIMQRDNKFRIGYCRLMYDGGFGVSMRARQEKAVQAWILSVHENKIDAMVQEQVIGFKYGIPDRIFEHAMQTPSMNMSHQEYSLFIREFWNQHQPDYGRIERCLNEFHRDITMPIWTARDNNIHIGRYSFVAQACNILNEVMNMRTFEKQKEGGSWEPISISSYHTTEKVYSIRVNRGSYISNDIVAHGI